MAKYYLSFVIILLSFNSFALEISGTVTDQSGAPVSGALVKFINPKNPSLEYSAYTDGAGKYVINETFPVSNKLLFCYPNPFNKQTVISFHLNKKQRVELAVYNIAGQKIRVISSGNLDPGHHQFIWDGLSYHGAPVVPGVYVCSLQTGKSRPSSFKMIVLGGENIAVPITSSGGDPSGGVSPGQPQIYSVSVSGNGFATHHVPGIDLAGVTVKDFVINRGVWTPFSTTGDYLSVYNGTDYAPIFVKGINLGSAVPGSWPGQIAISSAQYARWFKMMANAGFNTIRIYTLHYPWFYDEFARYNKENPDKPLYLLQGVWLNEEYPNETYPELHTLTGEFDKDIKDMIDCLHGNKKLGHRYGYAYGNFTADVSQWVLGLIVGREVYAYEIDETDDSKPANTAYSGAHLSISNASPSEVWATERLDRLIAYEREKYKSNRPVAFSSWPTLDPLTHPSEPWGSGEDEAELDLNKIKLTNAPGGFFISYHIYSYFPNFINRDEKYQDTTDDMGRNPYLGYLEELRSHYTNYPVMVSEFGVPSSWGIARYSPSGMHHGGLTEEEQGKYTMRMFLNIYDTRYCGGIVFSWMDEWSKTTWITHALSSGRRPLWHNITSPENNYGLIQFAPNPAYYADRKTQNFGYEKISKTSVWHDFAFFNMETTLKSPLVEGDTLWIALDTYKRNMGESTLPNRKRVLDDRRAEFLVRVTSDSANLYVSDAYNLRSVTLDGQSQGYQTKLTDGAPWILSRWQSDYLRNRPNTQDIGKLSIYKGNGALSTHHAVQFRTDGSVFVRIPWTLIHFSDPSSSMVVDDGSVESFSRCQVLFACGWQYLNSIRSEGVAVTMVYKNEIAKLESYTWKNWDMTSEEILDSNMYIEKEKASLTIIREGLENTSFTPK